MIETSGRNDSFVIYDNRILLGHRLIDKDSAYWNLTTQANPHFITFGLSGSGKTFLACNKCLQLINRGKTVIILSYAPDIDDKLSSILAPYIKFVDHDGLGFNPLQICEGPLAHIDNASLIRDIFAWIFPNLGERQLGRLREAILQGYSELGWDRCGGKGLKVPDFEMFYQNLKELKKKDSVVEGLLTRLDELQDYGFFKASSSKPVNLLNNVNPSIIIVRLHRTQNEVMQKALASLVLLHIYQHMPARGVQQSISTVILFEEAHRISKLTLIPRMLKECRKYGIAAELFSPSVGDFDDSLISVVGNFLAMRLNEVDAKKVAKIMATDDNVNDISRVIKVLPKHQALYFGTDMKEAVILKLVSPNFA